MHYNINILIVEDEPLIADDIKGYLNSAGYKNVDVAFNAEKAIAKLDLNNCDFIFLDINLESEMNGIELAKKINSDYLLPFSFITSYSDSGTIQEVKNTYPVGYIVKPFNGKEIPAVLEIGYELFYTYIGPNSSFDFDKLNKLVSEKLSTKEMEVILKITEGKNNKQIAEELFVSVNTIKTHLKNIFVKLDITSRSEAIVLLNKVRMK